MVSHWYKLEKEVDPEWNLEGHLLKLVSTIKFIRLNNSLNLNDIQKFAKNLEKNLKHANFNFGRVFLTHTVLYIKYYHNVICFSIWLDFFQLKNKWPFGYMKFIFRFSFLNWKTERRLGTRIPMSNRSFALQNYFYVHINEGSKIYEIAIIV